MVRLVELVARLSEVVEQVHDEPLVDRAVRLCTLVEADMTLESRVDRSDEVVLIGLDHHEPLGMALAALAPSDPALVIVRGTDREEVRSQATHAGLGNVVRLVPNLAWGRLFTMVDRMIRSGPAQASQLGHAHLQHSDLFSIATSLASQTGGYVSIDDSHARVLAFSPLDEHADRLRRDSILGRGAPEGHHEHLRRLGVWEALRNPGHVVELPGEDDIRARLGVGIIDDRTALYLGTIWVQEGAAGFTQAAHEYLVAASTLARQTILRADYIETRAAEAQLQLLGLQQRTEKVDTIAGIAGVSTANSWLVVGFHCAPHSAEHHFWPATLLRLHAVSLGRRSTVTVVGQSVYVVVPDPPAQKAIRRWAQRAVDALRQESPGACCASGPVVDSLEGLPGAREAVDVLVDELAKQAEGRFAAYEEHRSQLAVARVVEHLKEGGLLTGKPVEAILATTHVDGQQLLGTVRAYLHGGQQVTRTAKELHIHPNTLRQRLRRVERLVGLSLDDPEERLLLDLELRAYSKPGGAEG